MSRNIRKSCNKGRGKKATQFKPGYTSTVKGLPKIQTSEMIPRDAASNQIQPLERLSRQEAADMLQIRGSSTLDEPMPYTLRPKPEKEIYETGNVSSDENFIVNTGKMSELIRHMHAVSCPRPNIKVNVTNRIGLCIYMSLRCDHCGYESPELPMSETVKPRKGPPAGVLNSMVVLPVLKTKIGLDDVTSVLTCLNIKPPSKSTLQRKLNSLANSAVKLNEEQMADNQKYVVQILKKAEAEPSADVQFDVAYTCRPQGGCEKAAQSFGALIEHSTTRKLPIAIATANKHCNGKDCKHTDCSKNYPCDQSIASSERVLLHQTLDTVDSAGHLQIKSLTTDAGTQSAQTISYSLQMPCT